MGERSLGWFRDQKTENAAVFGDFQDRETGVGRKVRDVDPGERVVGVEPHLGPSRSVFQRTAKAQCRNRTAMSPSIHGDL